MNKVIGIRVRPLAVSLGSLLSLTVSAAHALTIDNFNTGTTGNLFYDGAMSAPPPGGFLGSYTPAAVPGGTRQLSMGPLASGAGVATFGTNAASGPSSLIATASPGEQLFVSVGYGGLSSMNLDLSGQDAFRFEVQWLGSNLGTMSSPVSLTIYANTLAVPGTNGTGSGVNTALTGTGTFDVPFSSFFVNSSSGLPANWADVDQLAFAFSGIGPRGLETLTGFRINSISAVSTVPEADGHAMLVAGLAMVTWLARRNARKP